MENLYQQTDLETLQTRLRKIRESRSLTLVEAANLSGGSISAIALGSYERGDRAISAAKLITIASMYQLPVSELFESHKALPESATITVDLRMLLKSTRDEAVKILPIVRAIAKQRGDWNGEVISLRATDLANLVNFAGMTTEEIRLVISQYAVTRSK